MTKMLIDRSVVEQVLKTLEEAEQCPVWPNTLKKAAKVPESADALRTALAQPEQVGTMRVHQYDNQKFALKYNKNGTK